jgi:hypothetical protein
MNAEQNLKTIADNVKPNLVDDATAIDDITGNQHGRPLKASRSNKLYYFRPVALLDVPRITELVNNIQNILISIDGVKVTEQQVLSTDQGGVLRMMAELIMMGINYDKNNITVDRVLQEFSIGDFPKAYQLTLDMNDFLSGMNQILMERMKTTK